MGRPGKGLKFRAPQGDSPLPRTNNMSKVTHLGGGDGAGLDLDSGSPPVPPCLPFILPVASGYSYMVTVFGDVI